MIVAGAAGERIAFGRLSTGVSDDLHAATSLARSMVTSFGMSEALGPVTIGEKGGEVFLGASLQDLGSVGPSTLDLIDREVERLVGDAEAKAALVLDRNWSTVEETANALLEQETLSGVALEAVLSTVQDASLAELQSTVEARRDVRRSNRILPGQDPRGETLMRRRISDRLPAVSLVMSMLALILSASGLADAARKAVIDAIDGHRISAHPVANGLLVLGKNKKFPASAIPTVNNASRVGGMTVDDLSSCPPTTENLGTWCLETSPYPLTNQEVGQNNYFFANQKCVSRGGYLPSAGQLIGAANRVKLESTIHDNQRHGDRRPGSVRGPERQTGDELDARDDGRRLGRRRLRGRKRRLHGRPAHRRTQPGAAAGRARARDASVRHGLQQRDQGRLRGLRAGLCTRELPLRLQQGAGRERRRRTVVRLNGRERARGRRRSRA